MQRSLSLDQLLVGLDIGTTHVKAGLLSANGEVLHVARRPTPTRDLAGGLSAHPPDELLAAVEATIAECSGVAGKRPIEAIGIASMAEAGCLVDPDGRAIDEVIPWFDPRSEGEAGELEAAVGAAELFATTGLRAHGKYSLPKLMWLARHRQGATGRATGWAGVAELAGLHLSGRLATNASLACRTLAFDVGARAWSAELLGFAGLSPERMPEVLPFGRAAGSLLDAVASRLGMRSGIPIVVAGHDHVVGAFGAGVVEPGQALDSMGSAEACLVVTERPAIVDDLRVRGYSVGCHVLDDRSYVLAGLQASGAVVEWFIDTFLGELPDSERYVAFARLLSDSLEPTRPGHVLALPYLRGRTAPRPDPAAGLELCGLRDGDGLTGIAVALVDGAAYAVRWIFDELENATGVTIGTTTVIGGGVRNERWLAAKAALVRGRLEVADEPEAVAVGAALAAGVGAGVFASPEDAVQRVRAHRSVGRPKTSAAFEAFYRERFLPAATGAATNDSGVSRSMPRESEPVEPRVEPDGAPRSSAPGPG